MTILDAIKLKKTALTSRYISSLGADKWYLPILIFKSRNQLLVVQPKQLFDIFNADNVIYNVVMLKKDTELTNDEKYCAYDAIILTLSRVSANYQVNRNFSYTPFEDNAFAVPFDSFFVPKLFLI